MLLSFLFTSITRSAQFENKIEKAKAELLERQHIQTRLQDLFLTARNSSLYTKKLPGDKKESLIAVFDHGIDPDPAFSGPVLARVYLEEGGNFSLALWPIGKEQKNKSWRNEILLSHVDDFEFHLLGKKTEERVLPVNTQFSWVSHWSEKRSENPSMIRLTVRQMGRDLSYAFFFSSSEPLVTYWEGTHQ